MIDKGNEKLMNNRIGKESFKDLSKGIECYAGSNALL